MIHKFISETMMPWNTLKGSKNIPETLHNVISGTYPWIDWHIHVREGDDIILHVLSVHMKETKAKHKPRFDSQLQIIETIENVNQSL